MQRVVRPELLDSLPFEDPEALRNRDELRAINAIMGNYAWLEGQARKALPEGARSLELGCGSADFPRRLAQRGLSIPLDGLDLCPPPSDWPADRRWWRRDLRTFDTYEGYDAVFANLILHQFEDEDLARVGQRIRKSARFVFACEPSRRAWHLAQFRVLALVGRLGRVSRNDGAVSIRAGFLGEELPRLLGLERSRWRWRCSTGFLGYYRMVAVREDVS